MKISDNIVASIQSSFQKGKGHVTEMNEFRKIGQHKAKMTPFWDPKIS